MQTLWILLVLIAAALNLAPAVGAVSPDRMTEAYGVALGDSDLQILMRHRAALFGVVGGLLVVAAFRRSMRPVGYAVGFFSMLSFLLIAWLVGDYNAQIRRLVLADMAGIASLAAAAAVHFFWLRRPAVLTPRGG